MAVDNKFKRCPEDHPNRCQGKYSAGQCPYFAVEGAQFCAMHSGPGQQASKDAKALQTYRLNQWSARVGEFAQDEAVKSLREEIGIARLLLETLVNQCTDAQSLIGYGGKIDSLLTKVEKLVSSCHRLEAASGMLLDKGTALHLAANIVEIIGKYIQDADLLEKIGNSIVDVIAKSQAKA